MSLMPRQPVSFLEFGTSAGGHWSPAAQKPQNSGAIDFAVSQNYPTAAKRRSSTRNAFLFLLCFALPAFAADGLIAVESKRGAKESMDRLEAVVKDKGLNVFARIDHAAGAAKIGKTLRATELLIFGNPQGGTPFMECAQSAGIDLPLKALVWQDGAGRVWIGYNDPAYLAARHGVATCPAAAGLAKALADLVGEAIRQ